MRSKKYEVDHNSEFELDLAPLLAVMVKLVPVLLLSSAFVQMMIIESELPQVVQQAIQQQEQQDKPVLISMTISNESGMEIQVSDPKNNKYTKEIVPLKNNAFDFEGLHQKLLSVKNNYPEIFKLELNPADSVSYDVLVKVMDEARQARDPKTTFPIKNPSTGDLSKTQFMFPEVVFANSMEG